MSLRIILTREITLPLLVKAVQYILTDWINSNHTPGPHVQRRKDADILTV